MLLQAKINVKIIALADLMPCFKQEEVLEFCRNCDQFGQHFFEGITVTLDL